MIQQEILKGLTLHVGNGGMSLKLELGKHDCKALFCHTEGCADYKEGDCKKEAYEPVL